MLRSAAAVQGLFFTSTSSPLHVLSLYSDCSKFGTMTRDWRPGAYKTTKWTRSWSPSTQVWHNTSSRPCFLIPQRSVVSAHDDNNCLVSFSFSLLFALARLPQQRRRALAAAIGRSSLLEDDADKEDCPICLLHLHESEALTRCDHCGHQLHLHCMTVWAAARRSQHQELACPLCRETFW